jgi:hypothetical protein
MTTVTLPVLIIAPQVSIRAQDTAAGHRRENKSIVVRMLFMIFTVPLS